MHEFTRSNLREMQQEMTDVLNNYGFKNVNFAVEGASFRASEATIKIKANIAGVKTMKETALELYAKRDGIDPDKRGPKGERLIEYHTRKPKYPYIYVTVRGTRYKCSRIQARMKFAA